MKKKNRDQNFEGKTMDREKKKKKQLPNRTC